MATSLAIWNHAVPSNPLARANPSSTGSSSATSDGAGISGNDFLTLLVTELKNQDPTANNDPNAYVNQLVQVNSLEQLININQTLTTGLGVSGATPGGGSQPTPGSDVATETALAPHASARSTAVAVRSPAAIGVPVHSPHQTSNSNPAISTADGNLSVPPVNHAAQRVVNALRHHTRIE